MQWLVEKGEHNSCTMFMEGLVSSVPPALPPKFTPSVTTPSISMKTAMAFLTESCDNWLNSEQTVITKLSLFGCRTLQRLILVPRPSLTFSVTWLALETAPRQQGRWNFVSVCSVIMLMMRRTLGLYSSVASFILFLCRYLLISTPRLGVYYFLSLTCLSVCPSVCLARCSFKSILLFCFLMELSHFWPPSLRVALYKTLFFDFWFRPLNAKNLQLHKIA